MTMHESSLNISYADWCLPLSLTALILSIPANLLPFMRLELYGDVQSSTIWQGVISLYQAREFFVAFVIFFASLVIPFLKIFSLIYLSWRLKRPDSIGSFDHAVHRAIEVLGRWSMLDIFLVAILVAILKFGALAQVGIGIGALFFLGTVLITMIVSELLSRTIRQQQTSIQKVGHDQN